MCIRDRIGNGKISALSIINFICKDQDTPQPKVVKVTSKSMDADIIDVYKRQV